MRNNVSTKITAVYVLCKICSGDIFNETESIVREHGPVRNRRLHLRLSFSRILKRSYRPDARFAQVAEVCHVPVPPVIKARSSKKPAIGARWLYDAPPKSKESILFVIRFFSYYTYASISQQNSSIYFGVRILVSE